MENQEKKSENIETVKKQEEYTLPYRALQVGFLGSMAISDNEVVNEIKKLFKAGDAEGYHIERLGAGKACFRQFFKTVFTDAIMEGKVENNQFSGKVVFQRDATGRVIRPKSELNKQKITVEVADWKEEPNLAITIKVKEKK